jgi:integrase
MDLYDRQGCRKYLTGSERTAFLEAAGTFPPEVETFCGVLAHSGCRISEALALTAGRVDLSDGLLIFESLKKRRKGVYRAVPVPPAFLARLDRVHQIAAVRLDPDLARTTLLWSWRRTTAWRRICEVMEAAEISGLHATPKGLRHGFGIRAISTGVPLNMAQRWLGHANISTTAIYADAIGDEERRIAERMWEETCA